MPLFEASSDNEAKALSKSRAHAATSPTSIDLDSPGDRPMPPVIESRGRQYSRPIRVIESGMPCHSPSTTVQCSPNRRWETTTDMSPALRPSSTMRATVRDRTDDTARGSRSNRTSVVERFTYGSNAARTNLREASSNSPRALHGASDDSTRSRSPSTKNPKRPRGSASSAVDSPSPTIPIAINRAREIAFEPVIGPRMC
jgi:hypothetical protein